MKISKAIFGGGCFWCTEAVFKRLRGVVNVTSGYSGGHAARPTYEAVCAGTTGHAEVIQVEYDPGAINYETLIEVFFGSHDPTTLNRQGNDVGEQYRSVIYYVSDEQRQAAEAVKTRLEKDRVYKQPIITTIEPLRNFFPAEDYHRNYFDRNADQPYCQTVINPKLAKLRQKYSALLRE